ESSVAHHITNATIGTRPSPTSQESRVQAASPVANDDAGTTRERPANRSGNRPLARHECATPEGVANAGGTAGGSTSRPAWTRGCVILGGRSMVDEQQDAGSELEEALFEAPERGSADELLDAGAHAELDAMRHSTAHVMAEAVLELFPGTQLGIGPAIADGFYYDFKLDRPLT